MDIIEGRSNLVGHRVEARLPHGVGDVGYRDTPEALYYPPRRSGYLCHHHGTFTCWRCGSIPAVVSCSFFVVDASNHRDATAHRQKGRLVHSKRFRVGD